MKTRRHSRKLRKGGGYGFGGSILSNAGGPNAGSALWDNDTGKDCSSSATRAGNGFAGGKRKSRRRKHHRGGMVSNASLNSRGGQNVAGGRRRRKTRRGGAYVDYAQVAPRAGYTFNGEGVAGTSNTIPY
jgi:hypothetical protein